MFSVYPDPVVLSVTPGYGIYTTVIFIDGLNYVQDASVMVRIQLCDFNFQIN